jgi:dihydroorotase (multifunctional complex type)
MFDLAIHGGEVLTPSRRVPASVYVRDGRIAHLGHEDFPARDSLDATGLLVMPGMVDAHVHFMDPGDPEREDFPAATAAAARAGVTTVIEHTHAAPVISPADLEAKREHVAGRARIDFALAAHAWPDRLDEVASVWGAGAAFVKAFTCATHGLPGFDPARLRRLFAAAAECGAVCLVHCEEASLVDDAERELRAAGRADPGIVPEWRTRAAELTALAVMGLLARLTGARAVAAHLSHPDAVALVDRERSAGARLQAETCPQYLRLLEHEVNRHGALRKFTPPARAHGGGDLDAMWDALARGDIDFVSSDHAPATREQKEDGSIWDVHFGLPGVDTTLPILLDGAAAGRLSYERVVQVYAEGPARAYGLYPAKGTLRPGADADLVVVDPGARWTVRDEDVLSKAGWSPFAGRTLTGRAVKTFVRGRPAADNGRVLAAPGAGRWVPGAGARGEPTARSERTARPAIVQ